MNRNDLIIAINNLYDENINLKVRNEYLEAKIDEKSRTKMCADKHNELDDLTKKIIEYGKKKLFNETIREGYSSQISVYEDEDTKELKFTTLGNWLKNKMYTYNIPDNFSQEDIKNILCNEIEDLYEKEKEEAIIKYKKEKLEEGKE